MLFFGQQWCDVCNGMVLTRMLRLQFADERRKLVFQNTLHQIWKHFSIPKKCGYWGFWKLRLRPLFFKQCYKRSTSHNSEEDQKFQFFHRFDCFPAVSYWAILQLVELGVSYPFKHSAFKDYFLLLVCRIIAPPSMLLWGCTKPSTLTFKTLGWTGSKPLWSIHTSWLLECSSKCQSYWRVFILHSHKKMCGHAWNHIASWPLCSYKCCKQE